METTRPETMEEQQADLSLLSAITSTISGEEIDALYHKESSNNRRLVLVLDDDPTGIQTVHKVYVYMKWTAAILMEIFRSNDLAFIQTNSRSLPQNQAIELTEQILELALAASEQTGREFTIISRSDSSLRGHYPAETDAISAALQRRGKRVDGEILCFFLPEAGRFTVEDIHYIREGDHLTPVARTEFAKDAVFGYRHSNLKEYIEEKTEGRVKAAEVTSLPLNWLRSKETGRVTNELMLLSGGTKMVVNCADYSDLKHFIAALKTAENAGKRFLFRTAAAFVKLYGYISDEPMLMVETILGENTKGSVLTIAGSHTAKTTAQLGRLLLKEEAVPVELNVEALLNADCREEEINSAVTALEVAMKTSHPVLYTSRKVVVSEQGSEQNLQIARTISESLARVVQRLSTRPKAVIAKGGITSNDIAVKGLGMERAFILGQVRPTIPVVRAGEESRFPGLPYIIFPGNTGTEDDLVEVWSILSA
jgi:uncharacterized protein YgbK (DUF1537 family)